MWFLHRIHLISDAMRFSFTQLIYFLGMRVNFFPMWLSHMNNSFSHGFFFTCLLEFWEQSVESHFDRFLHMGSHIVQMWTTGDWLYILSGVTQTFWLKDGSGKWCLPECSSYCCTCSLWCFSLISQIELHYSEEILNETWRELRELERKTVFFYTLRLYVHIYFWILSTFHWFQWRPRTTALNWTNSLIYFFYTTEHSGQSWTDKYKDKMSLHLSCT